MEKNAKRILMPIFLLISFVCLTLSCLGIAHMIQKDFGKVDVTTSSLKYESEDDPNLKGNITYKLYKPKSATVDTKAPAMLLLHGYQNDHETNAAYAIELSRRGVVVMSIDEFGHGSTDISMINRGYVNFKVTNNYADPDNDKPAGEERIPISGQSRYKVLMNFSNLSFFDDIYSKDNDGNEIKHSDMGGVFAYDALSKFAFVDNTRMSVSGHSMGTWASWSVAAYYSGTDIMPKATILQAGELFGKDAYDSENIKFNNVLLLTAKYDEFNYFRDYSPKTVDDDVISDSITRQFLGLEESNEKAQWNKKYGNFEDGTARERALFNTNHRLLTHNHDAVTLSINWLKEAIGIESPLDPSSHAFMIKETLVLVGTLSAICAMVAFFEILILIPFFKTVAEPGIIQARATKVKKGWRFWIPAVITILTAGLTYPFMTQLGHGLLPLPESVFRMTIGNGFLAWYLLLIIVMLLTTIIPFVKNRKKNPLVVPTHTEEPKKVSAKEVSKVEVQVSSSSSVKAKVSLRNDYTDLGFSRTSHKEKFDWALLGKGALIAVLMAGLMYGLLAICEFAFQLDFRFIWPFFKTFTPERILQFLVYILIFVVFFVLNNSKVFAQLQNKGMAQKGFVGFLKSWWPCALMMTGGVLLLMLIEYIPFFIGAGPGMDLIFSSTFGGPFMSLMIVFVPQVLVFSILDTYLYRKTGNIWVGAILVAIMACWIVTGGSAIL